MNRTLIAIAAATLTSTMAYADTKPTEEETKKINEALTALGCEGGEIEKETEGTGTYEVDDAKCKFGGQWDIKFDSSFMPTSLTRD